MKIELIRIKGFLNNNDIPIYDSKFNKDDIKNYKFDYMMIDELGTLDVDDK